MKFFEDKYGIMFDLSLIDNFRDLIIFVYNIDNYIENGGYFVRYRRGDIREVLLEFMMG